MHSGQFAIITGFPLVPCGFPLESFVTISKLNIKSNINQNACRLPYPILEKTNEGSSNFVDLIFFNLLKQLEVYDANNPRL